MNTFLVPAGNAGNNLPAEYDASIFREEEGSRYYRKQPQTPPEAIEVALKNKPFGDILGMLGQSWSTEQFIQMANEWLSQEYPMLDTLVNYDIQSGGEEESKNVLKHLNGLCSSGMGGAAKSVEEYANKYIRAKATFRYLLDNDKTAPGHVLDVRYLPEIVFAFPVNFYIKGHSQYLRSPGSRLNELISFQTVFNLNHRSKFEFMGYDTPPPRVLSTINAIEALYVGCFVEDSNQDVYTYTDQTSPLHKHITIVTPYTHLALAEAKNLVPQIDPMVLGYSDDIPLAIIYERWSGKKVFPRILDLFANSNTSLEAILEITNETFWEQMQTNGIDKDRIKSWIDAYKKGDIFELLSK